MMRDDIPVPASMKRGADMGIRHGHSISVRTDRGSIVIARNSCVGQKR